MLSARRASLFTAACKRTISAYNEAIALATVVIVAAVLRLPSLINDGLWRDQAYVYVDVAAQSFNQFMQRVIVTEWHPPLYFLIAYGWVRVFGISEITLTILPYIFSVATTIAVFQLGTAIHSRRAGIIGALFFAVSPLAIDYSTEYVYPLATLLFTVLAIFVARSRRRPENPYLYAGIAIGTLLCVYTHYTSLLYLSLLVLWAFLPPVSTRSGLRIALAVFAGAAPFLLWLRHFMAQRAIGTQAPFLPLLWLLKNATMSIPFVPGMFEGSALIIVIVAAVTVTKRLSLNIDVWALGAIYLVALCVISADLMQVRYTLPFYGLICAVFGTMLAAFKNHLCKNDPVGWQKLGIPTVAILGISLILGTARHEMNLSRTPKSGIRSFVTTQYFNRDTAYAIAPDYMAATFAFYSRASNVPYVGIIHDTNSQVYRPERDVDWHDAGKVQYEVSKIRRLQPKYRYLSLIVDDKVVFSKGNIYRPVLAPLLQRLRKSYALCGSKRYPGRREEVVEYRFAFESAHACHLAIARKSHDGRG